MKLTIRLTCALAGVLAGGIAMADPLSLETARKLALENSRTLASYGLAVKSSENGELLQTYEFLPSLSLSSSAKGSVPTSSADKSLADSATAGVSVTATQTVFNGGKNSIQLAIDRIATNSARETARTEYYSVLGSIDSAWFSLLKAKASEEAANAAIASAELGLSISQTKLDAGSLSMADYLQSEATAEAQRLKLSQAKRDVSIYLAKVESLTGKTDIDPETVDFSVWDALIAKLSSYSNSDIDSFFANAQKAVLAGNPAIAGARLKSESADKSVSLSATAYLPTVTASVSGGFDYANSTGDTTKSLAVTLAGSLDLDAWKTATSVSTSKLASRQAALTLDETKRTADIDTKTAVYDCVAQARSVISSQKALDYANKYYESELELYKLSSKSSSDLSDAAALVSTDTQSLIAARYDFLSGISTIRNLAALDSDDAIRALLP